MALEAIKNASVDTNRVEKEEGVSTGIAVIEVTKNGKNTICYMAGANQFVDIDYTKRNLDLFDKCDYILMQLGIPIRTVEWVAG